MAIGDVKLMHARVFSETRTRAWKQQEGNKTNKQKKNVRKKREESMDRSIASTKISSPNGLTIARAYRSQRSLLSEAVDELLSI